MTFEPWIYRFGDVEVEPAAHRIVRGGVDVGLEPKAFAVLTMLLEQSGRALERDELLDRVWGHRHVTPGVLNRVIAQLRKALGDDAEHPRYIQTLHSLGYRFIADVQRVPAMAMPQTVEALAIAEAETEPAATATTASGTPQASGVPTLNRTRTLAFAAAAVIVIGAFAWMQQQQQARPAASIAILPFTSLSSNRDDSYFAEGLAVEMHDALAGVEGLKVAAQMSPAAAGQARDAKTVGERLGVATVLDATVRRNGSRIRISARLSDTRSGYTVWSHVYDRSMSDVFATQSEIANEVVQSLVGAIPGQRAALAKRLTPTKNVAAFDAYLKGLQQLLRSGGDDDGQDNAIRFFNQALAADSGFARAQAGICRVEIRRFENLHNVEAFDNARIACQRALNMDASLAEVDLALGDMYRASGDLDKALRHYRAVEHQPALVTSAHVGLAKVYAVQGRRDLAMSHFRQALERSPENAFVYSELGYQQYLDGRLPDAILSYRKAVQLQPDNAGLWDTLGALHLDAGNNAEAVRALDRSIAIEPSDSAWSNLGLLAYQSGDYAAAATMHRRAIQLNPLDFMIWANLGMALKADPATAAQSRDAYREAATRAQNYLEVQPGDARAVAALGLYQVELGDSSQAMVQVRRSERLGSQPAEVALLNAETLALLGNLEQARQRLAIARAGGVSESLIASNAVLRRLGLLAPAEKSGVPEPL